jgi:hypothetical protein
MCIDKRMGGKKVLLIFFTFLFFLPILSQSCLAWWDDSYTYRRNITNSSTTFLIPLNGTNSLDIDSNGIDEWIYGRPEYIYYNNENDIRIANETTEFYKVQTQPQVSMTGTAPSDLLLYCPMDRSDGVIWDLSGQGNNGTITGATPGMPRYFGNSYYFDNNDVIAFTTGMFDVSEGTVSFWFNSTVDTDNQRITHFYHSANKDRLQIYMDGGGLLKANLGADNAPNSFADDIEQNKWYFVTITWNTTHWVGYVNGTEGNTIAMNGFVSNAETFYISHDTYNFNGEIDEFKLYNRMLTTTEISDLYNAYKYTYLDSEESGGSPQPPNNEEISVIEIDENTIFNINSIGYATMVVFLSLLLMFIPGAIIYGMFHKK